jgi:hypothetical protein
LGEVVDDRDSLDVALLDCEDIEGLRRGLDISIRVIREIMEELEGEPGWDHLDVKLAYIEQELTR